MADYNRQYRSPNNMSAQPYQPYQPYSASAGSYRGSPQSNAGSTSYRHGPSGYSRNYSDENDGPGTDSSDFLKPSDQYRRSVQILPPSSTNTSPMSHRQAVRQSLPPDAYENPRRKSIIPDRTPGSHLHQPGSGMAPSGGVQYLGHRASIANPPVSNRLQPASHLSPRLVSSGTNSSSTVTSASTAAMSTNTQLTEHPAHSMKVVVVGDGGCGKTCLLISYSDRSFPEKYVPTVFENYITQTPHPKTQKLVELALWDTAGQEEYDRLRPLSYPETDLVIICFAVDCPNSLENVQDKWHPEILHFLPNQPTILVGLKTDRRKDRDCLEMLKSQGLAPVSTEQGSELARKIGAHYMECSSKDMDGVDDVFDKAISTVISSSAPSSPQQHSDDFPAAVAGKRRRPLRMCTIL